VNGAKKNAQRSRILRKEAEARARKHTAGQLVVNAVVITFYAVRPRFGNALIGQPTPKTNLAGSFGRSAAATVFSFARGVSNDALTCKRFCGRAKTSDSCLFGKAELILRF
jgi:hypothetical protein